MAAGHVGGGLALVGLLAFTGVTAIQLVVWQMAQPQLERGQMVSLLQGVNDATGIFIPFYLCTFAFALGIVVLAWGLAAACDQPRDGRLHRARRRPARSPSRPR